MSKTPKEMERIILADGWYEVDQRGSHRHYKHPTKQGKITIPFHSKDLSKRVENNILKFARIQK